MAPCTSASRSAAVLLAALLTGGAAPAATAQSGNGLYEPFPEAAVKNRAQRYVGRLGDRAPLPGRRYSDAELAAGVFVRPDRRGPSLGPLETESPDEVSTRAGARPGSDMPLTIQLLLLVLVPALPVAALKRFTASSAA